MPGKEKLIQWVEEMARQTEPKRIVWCDGSDEEYHQFIEEMQDDRSLIRLNQKEYPGSYLHRSHPSDVARTEKLTFICTTRRADAGPTNNWMSPKEDGPGQLRRSAFHAERNARHDGSREVDRPGRRRC